MLTHTAPLVRSALAGMLSPLPIHHRASHRRSAGAKRRQVTDHIAPKAHIPLRGLVLHLTAPCPSAPNSLLPRLHRLSIQGCGLARRPIEVL
jgi:hypothetical protein